MLYENWSKKIMPSIEKVGPKNSQTTIDPSNNDLL